MSRRWMVGQEGAPEDFEEILRDSDLEEEEGDEAEYLDLGEVEYLDLGEVEDEEPGEQVDEELGEQEAADLYNPEYLDPEYIMEPDCEDVGPPPTILGLYTQDGVEIFGAQPSSPLQSPLLAPLSTSPAAEIRPEHVVVTLEEGDLVPAQGDDDDALGEEFHLADEEYTFYYFHKV